jgi:hypothetical protein
VTGRTGPQIIQFVVLTVGMKIHEFPGNPHDYREQTIKLIEFYFQMFHLKSGMIPIDNVLGARVAQDPSHIFPW